MRILGYILLVVGGLSLLGGIVSPSGAEESIVIFGYLLKISMIVGGFLLVSKSNNKSSNK